MIRMALAVAALALAACTPAAVDVADPWAALQPWNRRGKHLLPAEHSSRHETSRESKAACDRNDLRGRYRAGPQRSHQSTDAGASEECRPYPLRLEYLQHAEVCEPACATATECECHRPLVGFAAAGRGLECVNHGSHPATQPRSGEAGARRGGRAARASVAAPAARA